MTVRVYAEVIGDPIDHSLSPIIHSFWLEALGIEAEYRRCQVTRAGLPAHLAKRRSDASWRGSNVTMPLKLDAIGLAEDATDQAITAGAANTLVPSDGKIVAANTDVGAIALILSRFQKEGAAIGSVALLGTGGAARAALVALKKAGYSAVRIQARDMAQAVKLAVEFGLEAEPAPITATIISDGLINATPLGMTGNDCLNCDLSRIPPEGWVFDLVSNPAETPLIAAANERGLMIATGLDMLVEQAATSFRLFFDADPPRDRDDELWHRLRS